MVALKVFYTSEKKFNKIKERGLEKTFSSEGMTKKGFLLIEVAPSLGSFSLYWIGPNYSLHYITEDIVVFTSSGYLECDLEMKGWGYSRGLKSDDYRYISSLRGRFLTILKNEEAYLSLLSVIDKESFFNALNSIRDYVYFSKEKPETSFLNELSQNKLFREEISRKQLKYLLENGYDRFVSRFIYKSSLINFNYENIVISHNLKGAGKLNLDFNFTKKGIYPSNIKAIIGKNGVGKSQTLKALKKFGLRYQSFKKVIAINVYQAKNRTNDPSFSNLRTDFASRINIFSSMIHLLKNKKKYEYFNTFEILRELLSKHFMCDDILFEINGELKSVFHIPFGAIDQINTLCELKFYRKDKEFKLSTGQNYILEMTLLLLLHINQYSCVLIDEPESYLHPNLIVLFKKILEVILEKSQSIAFISTHSIFFIRELPKESVVVIYDQDGKPLSRAINKETFGASLDSLASEIFFDEEVDNSFDDFVDEYKTKNKNVKIDDLKSVPTSLAMRILSK